ncbi:PIN domain-containing protein [Ruminococcus albus]|uniref:PIN domain-containing protein n=1 Tax=Ruminococcus albus TaxID=1264 RepID=UPI0004634B74|nr:PIN domain-containing protein [Ruminococcus albus]
MKIYLIDFENVKSKGLTGIDSLTEYDRVIIFYSENADTINFEMHQKVLISKAEVEYFKVHVGGKNALDFQLSTLLGYLVSKNYYSHIFVISNDKSFDFLHDFWHGKYIAAPDCIVYRTKTIAQAINYAGGKKQPIPDDDDDTDTAVFAPAEDISDSEQEQETPDTKEEPVKEVPEVKEAAPVKAEPAKVQPEKKEQPSAKSETSEKAVAMSADLTEKRTAKPAPKQEPAKEKAPKQVKKTTPAKEDEFTISAEELNALEASFSAYSIIDVKKAEKAEKKAEPAEVKAEVKEEPAKVEVPKAETPKEEPKTEPVKEAPKSEKPAEKPKAQNKAFFASLKEIMKKADCTAEMINHISQLLINSDTKEEFHNALAKDYKQDATELYKLLRPKYLRLKEMYAAEHPEYVSPDTVKTQPVEDTPKAEETVKTEVPAKIETPVKAETPAKKDVPAEEPAKVEKSEEVVSEKTEEVSEEAPAAEEKPAKKKAKTTKAKTTRSKKSDDAKKSEEEKKPAKTARSRTKKKTEKPAESPVDNISGDRLEQLLDGKCSTEDVELIRQLFREVPSRQQLYIRMIKQFGKKEGCVYYSAIKAEYEALKDIIK